MIDLLKYKVCSPKSGLNSESVLHCCQWENHWAQIVVVRWLIPVVKQSILHMLHNQKLHFFDAVPFTSLCPDEFGHILVIDQRGVLILMWKKNCVHHSQAVNRKILD